MSFRCLLHGLLILLCIIMLGLILIGLKLLNIMPKISTFGIASSLSPNLSSCSCEAETLTKQYVPANQLDDILKQRLKEYKEYQLRTRPNLDILVALANSPLQYPVRGFSVAPLQKSLIPGLALHTEKTRKIYKVSLSVKNGVLSLDPIHREQVDGQGQSELNISSTNLTQLNNMLSRVTYTSIIYHIRTSDLGNFRFENHEAKFPIIIQRPTVPVLYLGNDINSLVTIATKTFLRYKQLKVLINSIREFYPKIKIIVADDSLEPERVTGNNIEQYIMPPAQGWFAGRNLAVSQVTTKYFLWVDDDFEFLDETRIESFVEIMEAIPELDVLGGAVSGEQYYFSFEYIEKDKEEEEEGGCFRRIKGQHYNALPGFDGCFFVDAVVNFFMARTDPVRKVGFDPFLKRVGHTEFFIDGLGQLLVASCKGPSIGHQVHEEHKEYDAYRNQRETDRKSKMAHHFFKNYLKCIKY